MRNRPEHVEAMGLPVQTRQNAQLAARCHVVKACGQAGDADVDVARDDCDGHRLSGLESEDSVVNPSAAK